MTRTEAFKLARKLWKEGKSKEQIGSALREAGFVSKHTKMPVRDSTAYQIGLYGSNYSNRNIRRKKRSIVEKTTKTTQPTSLTSKEILRAVFKNSGFDANTKTALAELILDL